MSCGFVNTLLDRSRFKTGQPQVMVIELIKQAGNVGRNESGSRDWEWCARGTVIEACFNQTAKTKKVHEHLFIYTYIYIHIYLYNAHTHKQKCAWKRCNINPSGQREKSISYSLNMSRRQHTIGNSFPSAQSSKSALSIETVSLVQQLN